MIAFNNKLDQACPLNIQGLLHPIFKTFFMPPGQVNKETQSNPSAAPQNPPPPEKWKDSGMQQGDADRARKDQRAVADEKNEKTKANSKDQNTH